MKKGLLDDSPFSIVTPILVGAGTIVRRLDGGLRPLIELFVERQL